MDRGSRRAKRYKEPYRPVVSRHAVSRGTIANVCVFHVKHAGCQVDAGCKNEGALSLTHTIRKRIPLKNETKLKAATASGSTPEKAVAEGLTQPLLLRDPYQDFWTNVVVWISLAEALVPFTLLLYGTIFQFSKTGYNHTVGDLLMMGLGALALGYTILFAVTLVVAGLTSALLGLIYKSLGINYSNAVGGASVGGCVGLLLALPVVSSDFPSTLLLVVATVLGQIGGAQGVRRTYYQNRFAEAHRLTVKFGIRQLMVLTAWLALAMTLLKRTGMTTESYFFILGVWLTVQLAGLIFVYFLNHSATRRPLANRST